LSGEAGRTVTAAIRPPRRTLSAEVPLVSIAGLEADTDWTPALSRVHTVVHLAAQVPMVPEPVDALRHYRRTNVAGTINLARQAADRGIRRFIFVSSIKVNGETSAADRPFTAELEPAPEDHYGVAKLEAENGLREVAQRGGMQWVVVRPPLVYGPGVKGNFHAMMRWVYSGVPLPLGAIHNRRSLIALDNLVDVLVSCIDHPAAANQTFLASDSEDLSTTELLRRVARALGRSPRLLPVPRRVLMLGAQLLGKQALSRRLCESLYMDSSKTRTLLGWSPRLSVDEGLRIAAEEFLSEARV
jgi:nucleoside-diphosphate-sugar epimerase